jgi:hypothetical protein
MVFVNGDLTGVEYAGTTWGDVLGVLDEQRAASGDIVTGVRIGAVEVPAFRTSQALSQELAETVDVFIETGRVADLLLQTLDEADAASQTLVEAAVALAASYRAQDVSAANRSLPDFAENLGTLIVLTHTVAEGAGVDLAACGDGVVSAMDMITSLIAHIDLLLAARQAGDWTRVGDVLGSDIAGAVQRWPMVLRAIRQAAPALRDVA